jgi:tRNA-dihydrouridine synthase B
MEFLGVGRRSADPPLSYQRDLVLAHYDALLSHHGLHAGLRIARKHLGWYVAGLPGAAQFRHAAYREDDPRMVMALVRAFYGRQCEGRAA